MKEFKQAERRIAKELGGMRIGILGKEDVLTEDFSVEVKTRKSLPRFIKKCYEQAVANTRVGKIPLVILKEDNKKYADALVIIKFKCFKTFLGKINERKIQE